MASHPIEFIARGLLVSGSRILLCRDLKAGYYYLPGGHVEFGELAAAALGRELEEEAGLVTRVGTCLLVHENAFETAKRQHHEVNVVFRVELEAPRAEEVSSREPAIGFEWVDMAALVDLDLRPAGMKAWLVSGAGAGATAWASTIEE